MMSACAKNFLARQACFCQLLTIELMPGHHSLSLRPARQECPLPFCSISIHSNSVSQGPTRQERSHPCIGFSQLLANRCVNGHGSQIKSALLLQSCHSFRICICHCLWLKQSRLFSEAPPSFTPFLRARSSAVKSRQPLLDTMSQKVAQLLQAVTTLLMLNALSAPHRFWLYVVIALGAPHCFVLFDSLLCAVCTHCSQCTSLLFAAVNRRRRAGCLTAGRQHTADRRAGWPATVHPAPPQATTGPNSNQHQPTAECCT
eukprot:1156706-Pelagomonas_calceolata.AAC.13